MIFLNNAKHVVVLTLLISLLYAILRYNVLYNVPWSDFPVYVLNKAIALSIIILMLFDHIRNKGNNQSIELIWLILFIISILHAFLSLSILGADYYEKFYDHDRLNLTGSLSLMFGILAFTGIIVSGIIKLLSRVDKSFTVNNSFMLELKSINISFIAAHVFIMGFKGWLTPDKWPGYLLPISLISFILLIIIATIFAVKVRNIEN